MAKKITFPSLKDCLIRMGYKNGVMAYPCQNPVLLIGKSYSDSYICYDIIQKDGTSKQASISLSNLFYTN